MPSKDRNAVTFYISKENLKLIREKVYIEDRFQSEIINEIISNYFKKNK